MKPAAPALALALLAACSGPAERPAPPRPAGAGAAAPPTSALRAACGERVVVQTDWFPEPEHGQLYQLAGPAGALDAERGRYAGPIGSTGVTLEIRSGGPFTGNQDVTSQLYQDPEILLGYVNTDEAARLSAKLPTVAVMATLDKSPQCLMWDPARWSFQTIAEIGRSRAKVLYFEGTTAMSWLLGKGLLRADQVDSSYTGSPDRFVAAGDLVQQGFATSEPYKYEHDIAQWRRPVRFLLVHDAGYATYVQALAARPAALRERRGCLRLLVPMLQRAAVDYAHAPAATNATLVRIVARLRSSWTLSPGGTADAARRMVELGIIGNGPDRTLGNFDPARVRRVIEELVPVFTSQRLPIKPGLRAEDLITNDLIDPAIGL